MNRTNPTKVEAHFGRDLHTLAAGLEPGASDKVQAIKDCIEFVLAETRGHWHNRARAMMCRRLKHCELTADQRQQLVECILDRLASGQFSEQFRDQLRLVLHLDPHRAFEVAHQCLAAPKSKEYIRRLATWVANHEKPTISIVSGSPSSTH